MNKNYMFFLTKKVLIKNITNCGWVVWLVVTGWWLVARLKIINVLKVLINFFVHGESGEDYQLSVKSLNLFSREKI